MEKSLNDFQSIYEINKDHKNACYTLGISKFLAISLSHTFNVEQKNLTKSTHSKSVQ